MRAWPVDAKVREPHLNPPGSYELSWLFPLEQGRETESSNEPGVQMRFANFRVNQRQPCFRARQKSGEGIVRRKGCPKAWQKGVFGESVSCLPSEGLLLKHLKTLRGQRRHGLSKTPFWTTVSPHDAFSAPLARTQCFRLDCRERYWLKAVRGLFGKEAYTTIVAPLLSLSLSLSLSLTDPEVTEPQKSYGVCTISWGEEGQRNICHRSGKKGIDYRGLRP